jgi:hypothetical protein
MGEAAPAGGGGPAGAAAEPRGRPLAAALARLGYADVGVGVREVLLRTGGGARLHAALPPAAVALVDDADAGRTVRPVAFRLRARAVADRS